MGLKIDITGQKFSNLLVIRATEKRDSRGSIIWLFYCDCGNKEVYKPATDVKSGSSVSCGCLKPYALKESRYSSAGKIKLYLLGDKIGKLTVENVKENLGYYKGITYICRCDCGEILECKHHILKSGHLNSCGCLHKESSILNGKKAIKKKDITNNKYKKLTAIKCLDLEMKSTSIWELKCDCGGESKMTANDFLRGRAGSCGCITSEQELVIKNILDNNSVNYKREYWFRDLVGINGGFLRFDFGILNKHDDLVFLLEYDGYYHFNKNKYQYKGVNVHDITKTHDSLKNDYCRDNNILLYRLNDSKKVNFEMTHILQKHCQV